MKLIDQNSSIEITHRITSLEMYFQTFQAVTIKQF